MSKEKHTEVNEQSAHAKQSSFARIVTCFNQHNKLVYGVVISILVILCGYFAFQKFYVTPQAENASAMMQKPIEFFQKGDSLSLTIALEGNEEFDGFLSIASSFGMTNTAKTANYFAGLCYLKLKNTEEALTYLEKYNIKDEVYWYACQAVIGDIYADLGENNKAISYYKKACEGTDPYFTPINLFKLGQTYEADGNYAEAVKAYETIEKDFYSEYTKMGVAKFLEDAKLK